MLVRLNNEQLQRADKIKIDLNNSIKDAREELRAKEEEAEKLYFEYIKKCREARDTYNEKVTKATEEYNKEKHKIIEEAMKNKEDKNTINYRTGNAFIDALLDILSVEGTDRNNTTKPNDENNKENKTVNTLDEKINFITENINNLSGRAKAYVGLHGARLVKVRNEHTCNCCGNTITANEFAVVTHELKNTKSGVSFKELWDNDYELFIKDGKYYASTGICNIELTAHRHWIDLDCAIEKINEALNFTE